MLLNKDSQQDKKNENFDLSFQDDGFDIKYENIENYVSVHGDKIYIKKIELTYQEFKKISSIMVQIDTKNEEKFIFGKIISVGSKVDDLQVGDYVYANKWGSIDNHVTSGKYSFVKIADVLGVLIKK